MNSCWYELVMFLLACHTRSRMFILTFLVHFRSFVDHLCADNDSEVVKVMLCGRCDVW